VTAYDPGEKVRSAAYGKNHRPETILVRAWTFDFASTIAPKTRFRYIGNGGGSHAFTLAAFDIRSLSDL
jgi:hypothetical protein